MEDERHASFLDNRLVEGMEMAFTLQHRRAPLEPVVSQWFLHDAETGTETEGDLDAGGGNAVEGGSNTRGTGAGRYVSIFSPLYHCCIRPHRKRRADYVLGLLRRCDSAVQQHAVLYSEHIASVEGKGGREWQGEVTETGTGVEYACFLSSLTQSREALHEERIRLRRATATAAATAAVVESTSIQDEVTTLACFIIDICTPDTMSLSPLSPHTHARSTCFIPLEPTGGDEKCS